MSGLRPVTVRRVDPEGNDCRDVIDLILAAFDYMEGRIDPPPSAYRLTPDTIRTQTKRGLVLLVEMERVLLGCVFLTRGMQDFHLGKLAIVPACQRRGIGRSLFEASAEIPRAEGFREIELQTRVELIENQSAFTAIGFCEVGRTTHAGYDRPTFVTMRCQL